MRRHDRRSVLGAVNEPHDRPERLRARDDLGQTDAVSPIGRRDLRLDAERHGLVRFRAAVNALAVILNARRTLTVA